MTPPDFNHLFTDGAEISDEWGTVIVRPRHIGELLLPTGKLIACDPLTLAEPQAFTQTVKAGVYPVLLSIAHLPDGDQRVAAAMLQLSAETPVSWTMATLPDEELDTLAEDEMFGYSVDSGVGCFMDARAWEELEVRLDEVENDYFEQWLALLEDNYVDTWSHFDVVADPITQANVIAFSAGWGEGAYASYFGRDARGKLACLVTDFALFEAVVEA